MGLNLFQIPLVMSSGRHKFEMKGGFVWNHLDSPADLTWTLLQNNVCDALSPLLPIQCCLTANVSMPCCRPMLRGGPRRRGVPANESSCAVSDSVGSLQQSRTKFIESRTSNTYNDTLLILTTSRQLKYAFTSRFHLQRTLCTWLYHVAKVREFFHFCCKVLDIFVCDSIKDFSLILQFYCGSLQT